MASQTAMLLFQALASVVVADVLFVPSFDKYPEYTGNLAVAGSITLAGTDDDNTTSKQALTWYLTGLDTACSAGAADNVVNGCGIHIHTGTSCASKDNVGGHYYSAALGSDPWLPIVYIATADGKAWTTGGVEVVTGLTTAEITGRVMVVHALSSGARIACGVIGTATGGGPRTYVASFAAYPGYAGSLKVQGSMSVVSTSGTSTTAKQTLTWSLIGLDSDCKASAADSVTNGCGIHIHTGTSCASAGAVGGHYYSSDIVSGDPWLPVVYVSTDGTSNKNAGVDVVTGLSAGDITGRVMVVHALASGARIACGVIGGETGAGMAVKVPSFAAYPDYAGSLKVSGSVEIKGTSGTQSTAKQTLTWDLEGVDTACTAGAAASITNGCGVHVHTGTSCAAAANVGGHYYSSAVTSDPWLPVVYVAGSGGKSKEDTGVEVVTGLSNADIMGRVVVVHELKTGTRIACGVIEEVKTSLPSPSTPGTSTACRWGMVLPFLLAAVGASLRAL